MSGEHDRQLRKPAPLTPDTRYHRPVSNDCNRGYAMSNDEQPRDHAPGDSLEDTGHHSLEEHVKSKSTWLRLFFMLVVIILYAVSRLVVFVVVLLQFFWLLFTGDTNQQLRALGQSLATYTYEIIRYLTFNSDERPFPFDLEWPPSEATGEGNP